MTPRKAAQAADAKTYEGRPCRYGHGTHRYTTNGNCVECDRAHQAATQADRNAYFVYWRAANRARSRAIQKRANDTYRTRHAIRIADDRAHRQAVQRNTILELYYADATHR